MNDPQPPAAFTPEQVAAFQAGCRDAEQTGCLNDSDAHRLRVLILGADYAQTGRNSTAA